MTDILDLTIELCRRASVTPDDAGCQQLLGARLARLGFTVEHLRFGQVDNLWVRHGTGDPVVAFVGHTDVVPTGPIEQWSSPPFEPSVRDGKLYARGAADMKGSVAAMTVALESYVRGQPNHAGTVGLLLTSDEEGPSIDGVKKVMEAFVQRGQKVHYAVIGEPSSKSDLGDIIRVGRRGSLHGHVLVRGVQGHIAYPALALNPIHAAAPALAELAAQRWDNGNGDFPPTTFQISNVHSGTGAYNVIPGELRFDFNFRFGTASRAEDLMRDVEAILVRHNLDYRIEWDLSGSPFLTQPGKLRAAATAAIEEITGIVARPDTGGGTSDGRFLAAHGAEVVELGPVNASIHKIDEHVRIVELEQVARIYLRVLQRLL
jgi:succinyl-diaminopimelate desuccinylase